MTGCVYSAGVGELAVWSRMAGGAQAPAISERYRPCGRTAVLTDVSIRADGTRIRHLAVVSRVTGGSAAITLTGPGGAFWATAVQTALAVCA